MKYINLIIAFLMGISFALAAPSVVKDTIQGPEGTYTLTDIKWEVPIGGDRTEIVTGTIQDVIRHLEVVAPEILEANNVSTTTADPSTDSPTPFDGTLSARIAKPDNVDCNAMTTVAKSGRIMDGVGYLHKVSGKPKNDPVSPPPPQTLTVLEYGAKDVELTDTEKSCGRVSCSYGAVIAWCNDNSDSYTLDSFTMIADGAEAVVQGCPDNWAGRTKGKSTYDEGWSVLVYGDPC